MANVKSSSSPITRHMMAAVVVGTALSVGPSAPAEAPSATVTDIQRYCQACWRNARLPADQWQDCTQQVFVRLLERLQPEKWNTALTDLESQERREFVRAIDAVKKRTQRARQYVNLPSEASDRSSDTELREKRQALANAAGQVLSPRQKHIVELSAGGWAVPEIAQQLGTTVERISDEKYKAIRKLRTHFDV